MTKIINISQHSRIIKEITKNFFLSFFYSIISITHKILNSKQKINFQQRIVYFSYMNNNVVLKPIERKLNGLTIYSLNSRDFKSFFIRTKNNNCIHFNNIISKPFFNICFSEKKIRQKFKKYLYLNYLSFLKQQKPEKIIMIDEASLPHSALTLVTNELGLTSIAMQHGVMYIKDEKYLKDEKYTKYKNRRKEETVDYIIVYSKKEQQFLIKDSQLFNKNNIKALGCPRYDNLIMNKIKSQKIKQKTLNKYGLKDDKIIVLWTTQTHGFSKTENIKNCKLLFNFFNKYKEKFNLLIKLHPGENQSAPLYNKWNKKFKNLATIINAKEDTIKLINSSDIILTKTSSTASEALIMNKLVFFIDLEQKNDTSYYQEYDFPRVRSKKDLEHFMRIIQSSEFRKKFSKTKNQFISDNFNNVGLATTKVVEFIKKAKK